MLQHGHILLQRLARRGRRDGSNTVRIRNTLKYTYSSVKHITIGGEQGECIFALLLVATSI